MKLLIIFIVLSIVNVIFSTARSILTIKGNKVIASLCSGGYFAFYNIMLIYIVADFPLWQKCIITFICNVIGVYIVKLIEEKSRKDKLWKIEATFKKETLPEIVRFLDSQNLSYNYIQNIGKYVIFNIFCDTQKESLAVKELLNKYEAKYFVSETKTL